MIVNCNLIRDGLTSTALVLDVVELNDIRRWITSSLRHSGENAKRYHFVAWANLSDISGTDVLEEVTGHATGTTFDIINKRELSGSHIELDLERRG